MGVCNCSMFCCMLLYVHSSIAIILMGKRELIGLLNLSSWCLLMVERLFLAVPRGCLQFVIVVFPDHTHLLFLTVNVEKTKIVVFRKGGTLAQNDRWYFAEQEVEIVNSFTYLGVVFTSGGSFMQNAKTLSGKALRARHQLLQIIKEVETPINISFKLFDSLVASVVMYGSEIWGYINAVCIERVHRNSANTC